MISLGVKIPKSTGTVCAIDNNTPSLYKCEVMGQVKDMPDGKVCLLEELIDSQQSVPVVRALVSRAKLVPIHLLNYRPETVTVYQCQTLTVVECVEAPVEAPVASVGTRNSTVSEEKKQTLWKLVESSHVNESSHGNLTAEQTEQLYELLLLYEDIFTCYDNEVGRTDMI